MGLDVIMQKVWCSIRGSDMLDDVFYHRMMS